MTSKTDLYKAALQRISAHAHSDLQLPSDSHSAGFWEGVARGLSLIAKKALSDAPPVETAQTSSNLRAKVEALDIHPGTDYSFEAVRVFRDRVLDLIDEYLPDETKPPLGQEPWRCSLPVITVQMLGDFGQEGFFEKTDEPVHGVPGVGWSQAAVDFACLIQGRRAVEPRCICAKKLDGQIIETHIACELHGVKAAGLLTVSPEEAKRPRALRHWSKDLMVPVDGCHCDTCVEARDSEKASGQPKKSTTPP